MHPKLDSQDFREQCERDRASLQAYRTMLIEHFGTAELLDVDGAIRELLSMVELKASNVPDDAVLFEERFARMEPTPLVFPKVMSNAEMDAIRGGCEPEASGRTPTLADLAELDAGES